MTRAHHWFHKLFSGVLLPLLTLLLCVLIFKILGVTTPPQRPEPSNSLQAKLQRLPPAEVMQVKSLDEIGGVVNIPVEGEVVPYREIQVATEVAGTITYKSPQVEAGNYVKKGDLLFRIDPTDYELDIRRLDQEKKVEYESLREIDQEISNVEKLIEVAQDDEQLRKQEIERLQRLPKGFASETELDKAKQSLLQSLNTRIGFENQLALLKKRRTRQETREQLIETQLELARKNLERTEIFSPIDGVVYREDAEVNSFIQRGAVIVTLEDTSKAEVIVNLRMDQLYWILDQPHRAETGESTDSRSYTLPPTAATVEYRISQRDAVYTWEGMLERYDGIGLDTRSRMVPVRIIVDEPAKVQRSTALANERVQGPKALVRGMFVRVVLHVRPQSTLSLVPNLAIQPGNRIWKFQPDLTVLNAESDPTLSKANRTDVVSKTTTVSMPANGETNGTQEEVPAEVKPVDSPSKASPDATLKDDSKEKPNRQAFNAEQWTAGRLIVLEGVTPVVSVSLDGQINPMMSDDARENSDTYWICETKTGDLRPGEFVVVSPLGGVTGDGSDFIRVPTANGDNAELAKK